VQPMRSCVFNFLRWRPCYLDVSGQVVLSPVLSLVAAIRVNPVLVVTRKKKDPMAFLLIYIGFFLQDSRAKLYCLFY
jgi:hypothetical protein